MMRTTVVIERAHLVARTREDGRHVYRKEGKAVLVAACAQPGASVAAIALVHGVNANLLRKWITRAIAHILIKELRRWRSVKQLRNPPQR